VPEEREGGSGSGETYRGGLKEAGSGSKTVNPPAVGRGGTDSGYPFEKRKAWGKKAPGVQGSTHDPISLERGEV